jgi:acyl transferase domain-containing protein
MCRFANAVQKSQGVFDAVSGTKSVPSGDSEAVAGQCRECSDGSNKQETEQLIARIHAAMAEDCDCPLHRTRDAEIDPAVLERISAAISQDQAFASLTTVRAAIADVLDAGCSCTNEKHPWEMDDTTAEELDVTSGQRVRFIDDVCRRILELQREPHGMDAGLREDALESQEFYELMQAYRHASLTNQNATVTAFEAVKLFVRMRVTATALRQRESEVRAEERERAVERFMAVVKEIKGPNIPRVGLYEAMLAAGREVNCRDFEA